MNRYPTREMAYREMLRRAENAFEHGFELPRLHLVEHPVSGEFSICEGDPPIEEGMRRTAGRISTTARG